MLLLVTIGLVLIAAVSLIIGFVQNSLAPIYISIGCSVAAALVLLVFSRMSRRQVPAAGGSLGSAAPEPGGEERQAAAVPVGATTAGPEDEGTSPLASVGAGAGAVQAVAFPIADYDELKVAEILPMLPELDDDELDEVRAREESGRARSTILRRIEAIMDGQPEDEAAGTAGGGEGRAASAAAGGFPIADYDELKVAEILPLLGQLDDEELEEVRAREVAGGGRATILKRIDQLAPAASPGSAAKATKATKTAAKASKTPAKAPTKTAAKAPAKAPAKTVTKAATKAATKATKATKAAKKRAGR